MKQKLLCLSLVFALLLTGFMPIYAEEGLTDGEGAQKMIDAVVDHLIIYGRYEDITERGLYRAAAERMLQENPELYTAALKGMLESIDQYSEYYTPEESEDLMITVSGEIVGIGVTIDFTDPETALIASVIADTPAERAGIKVGDIIVSANGENLRGAKSEFVLSRIRGEEGAEVYLEVERDGRILGFTMIREKIIGTSITTEVFEEDGKKLMYIRVHGFVSNTAQKFKEALVDADNQKISNLIIDLRDNGGGIFEQAVAMAENFVPLGKVITTADYKFDLLDRVFKGTVKNPKKYQTVILTNGYTASASEVFAASLRENDLAITVGQPTYGKGTIQSINSLSAGGMIKFTTGFYLTPNGSNLNGTGMKPDMPVENTSWHPNKADFAEFAYNKVYQQGDAGEEILLAKEYLSLYGLYYGEMNEVYDQELYYAVYAFQTQANLFPYGVLDLTTQINLRNYLDIVKIEQDNQLEAGFRTFGMSYLH